MNESPDLHPIVAAMRPSAEQIPAITTWGRDVVVTAGAGAGKTLTLVARYLALLAEGIPLRSVIAITFTEKAAREMRNRVRDEVRRYLELDGLPEAERDRWQAVYSGLDAARISTIHGLCAEILRSHPAEARIDPRFDVLDEGQGNLLRRQSVDETLAWAAEDPALVPLFELLGERGFRDALDTLLKRRLEAAETFAVLPDDVLAHWQGALTARQTVALAALMASPDWQDAAATVQNAGANQADDLLEIQRRAAAAAVAVVSSNQSPGCSAGTGPANVMEVAPSDRVCESAALLQSVVAVTLCSSVALPMATEPASTGLNPTRT
jgi:ATP-dependent exoDNAse (exonuclease V) beta subunit